MSGKYVVLLLDFRGTTAWEYDTLHDAYEAVDAQKGNNGRYGVHNAAIIPAEVYEAVENVDREYKYFYRHYGVSVYN